MFFDGRQYCPQADLIRWDHMPIHVQCCGLFLMVMLLYFYGGQKTIKLNTGRAFRNAFFMTFVCIIFDILSCLAITNRDMLPGIIVDFVSKTYLATLVGVSFFALMYMYTDIYTVKSEYDRIMLKYGIVVAAAMIMIYILPIDYYVNLTEGVLYSKGPSCYATYGFALATVVIVTVRLIRDRAKISKNRRIAVMIWIGVWILAALIQFFNPKLLLVGFASASGMLVLYLMLENPGYNIDRQTGLFNHEAFMQYAGELYAMKAPFATLEIILAHSSFKMMRTELEDEVIAEAVKYLSGITDAITFRNASTEILLVFTDMEKAESGVKAVRRRFEKGWGKNAGILVMPNWIYAPDSQIANNAEELLYLMKYVARDNKEFLETHYFKVTSELAQRLRHEKDIEQLIINSIVNDHVEVWYQPIFSTENHKFISAEALVRIRDDNGELVPPGAFIEIAERNGMILQLGEMVFRKVCNFLNGSHISLFGIDYIEVNLSVVQCAYIDLATDYIRIMEESGVSPKQINLEITESASMNARRTLLDNMKKLMDYGVTFSLDDFGTGQSNLDYIVDMPVDIVKFDKGMTNAYFENGKAKYIMDAAMNMIRGMDLKIVSEGIETEEQFRTMENLGINYIQGYYFSKPLPADEFLEFIKQNNIKKFDMKSG